MSPVDTRSTVMGCVYTLVGLAKRRHAHQFGARSTERERVAASSSYITLQVFGKRQRNRDRRREYELV